MINTRLQLAALFENISLVFQPIKLKLGCTLYCVVHCPSQLFSVMLGCGKLFGINRYYGE